MYDFDKAIDRRGTTSIKWNKQYAFGQKDGLLPFWIADTDFASVPEILDAIKERCNHPVIGYSEPLDSVYTAIQGWWERRHQWKPQTDWMLLSGHRYLFYPERSGAKGREGPGIYTGI